MSARAHISPEDGPLSTSPQDGSAMTVMPAAGAASGDISPAAPGGGTVEEQVEFSMLPARVQAEVIEWGADMEAAAAARHGERGPVIAAIARRRGVSAQCVRGRFDKWSEHGWRGLVNRAKFKGQTIPEATRQHWLRIVESHQRRKTTVKQAWRVLLLQLKAWESDGGMEGSQYAVPGYHKAPRRMKSGGGLPAGWSLDAFRRLAKKHAERTARSLGPKAFSATMPSVRASREGCEVGQFLFFDDETVDVLVNFVGNNTAMRPNAFHCLDFVSGCNIGRGFKPVIHEGNSRRTVSSNLTKADFDWFLLYILTTHGWNDRTGTVLIGEMGTACASDWLQDALPRVFGDRVKWDHSGRFGEPMKGMIYEGQSSGNFRFKAPLESWFKIERNYMSGMTGNTGRNRDEAPEENYGLMRECSWFLKQLEKLPLERRLNLRSPVMEWGQFCTWGNDRVEAINRRTDHRLGQYEKMGFTRPVLLDSFAGQPDVYAKLLANPEALRSLALADPRLRMMSPREVWDAHAPRLRRLAPWQVSMLMPLTEARPVKVSADRCIRVSDRDVDSEPLEYLATHCVNAEGRHLMLRPGDEFLAFLNPYAPGEVQLCEPDGTRAGAWIGTVTQRLRNSRADAEALLSQFGKARAAVAPVLEDIAARASAESNRRAEDRAVNRALADKTRRLTPAEHAEHAAAAALRGTFADPAEEPAGIAAADPDFRDAFAAD